MQRYLTVPKAFWRRVAIGYDFYDPFQLPVRLEPIPISEVRRMLKAGRILLVFGQPVHINVKIRSE